MQDAQSIKALILAKSPEITPEKFGELIRVEGKYSRDELQGLYNTFMLPLYARSFTKYADVIYVAHPFVDKLRTLREKREQREKAEPIKAFFSKKTSRDEDTASTAVAPKTDSPEKTKKAKPDELKPGSIQNYFKKK